MRRFAVIVVWSALAVACSLVTSLDDLEGSAHDAAVPDVQNEQVALDVSTVDGGDAGVGLSDLSRWSAFDLTTLGSSPTGLWGGTFDGRYVYLTPSAIGVPSHIMYRYDTTGSFTSASGWTRLDVATISAGATDFAGAAFDGTFVYFTPTWGGAVTLRFDPQGTFTQPASWAVFDAGSPFTFHEGATFDGRFVYFAPINDTVSRYDTTQSFTSLASWESVGVSTFVATGPTDGFIGAVYDGRYVYLLPPTIDLGEGNYSIVVRYDTQRPFATAASWSSFDTQQLSSAAAGFAGGAFDGRWLYLAPYRNNSSYFGLMVRYDTQAPFGATSSWETFDTQTLAGDAVGYSGAVFDGRYMYFAPIGSGGSGVVVQYDTQASFALASSWTTFDTHAVSLNAGGFMGVIFDGEFVYFVPGAGHEVVRFDARSPKITPPASGGSFF